MLKKKRIVRELLYIFLSVLCAILLSLSLLFLSRTTEKDSLDRMAERNTQAAAVYEELLGIESELRAYTATGDEAQLQAYRDHSRQLRSNLDDLSRSASENQEVMGYINHMESFCDRQARLWDQEDTDQAVAGVLEMLPDQKVAAQILVDENFRVSAAAYMEEMRVTDRQKLSAWTCIVVILIAAMIMMTSRLHQIMETFRENKRVARSLMAHEWDVEDVKLGPYEDLNELSEAINEMKREIVHYARQVDPKEKA